MKRILALSSLCLLLGACNVVITKTPLLSRADEAGVPGLKPGLWRFDSDPKCAFDESKPLVDWPKCAGGAIFKDGMAGFYERESGEPVWTTQPFILAAGTPRVGQAQAKVSGDVKVGTDPYIYVGARATKLDPDGRIVAIAMWPVQCGPPPPDDKNNGVTTKPLPGIEMKPDDPVCTTSSVSALRGAAKASEPWIPRLFTGHWLREADR